MGPQLSINICCRRRRSAANPPATDAAVDQWDRQTDGRMQAEERTRSGPCGGGWQNNKQHPTSAHPLVSLTQCNVAGTISSHAEQMWSGFAASCVVRAECSVETSAEDWTPTRHIGHDRIHCLYSITHKHTHTHICYGVKQGYSGSANSPKPKLKANTHPVAQISVTSPNENSKHWCKSGKSLTWSCHAIHAGSWCKYTEIFLLLGRNYIIPTAVPKWCNTVKNSTIFSQIQNVLAAISKGRETWKLCCNKILRSFTEGVG